MTAKRWLIGGFCCIAAAVLLNIPVFLFLLGRIQADVRKPFDMNGIWGDLGIVVIGVALIDLLFIAGVIGVIAGFILLAKESRGGPGESRVSAPGTAERRRDERVQETERREGGEARG